jgi:cation transport ATPase
MFLSLLVLSGGACYIGVKAYHILRGLPPLRQELAHPNSPSEPAGEEAEEMEQLNRRLVISSLTVGLAAGGAILFPPLGMAAAPPLLYLSLPTVQQLQRAWRRKEQQGNALFDLVLVTASLASGQPLAAALHFWLRSLSQRRLQRLRRAARQQWLAATLPDEGWVQRQGVRTKTPLHTIVASEILIVQAGELIAVDGVIDQGMALVDEHDLTQRLEPAVKEVCDRVFARTLTLAGELYVKVGKVGPETTAAYLDRTWQTATATQSALQCQGERLTAELTLPLLGLGALAAIGLGPLRPCAISISPAAPVWWSRIVAALRPWPRSKP